MRSIQFFSILLLAMCWGVTYAQQPSKEDLQKRTQVLLNEINSIKQSLDQTKQIKKQSLGDLRLVERKLVMRAQVVTNMKTEVWMVEREILKTYREIDTLKKELKVLKEQYAQSIVYAYKNRSNYDFLNFLFSSANFTDALRRMNYLKTYRSYRTQKAEDIGKANELLNDKIASLTGKRKEKEVAVTAQSVQMLELEKEKKEKDAVVSSIASKEKELTRMYSNKEKERKQIQAAIAAVIKREKDAAIRKEREEEAARRKLAADAAARKKATDAKLVAEGKAPTLEAVTVAPAVVAPSKRPASVLESTPEGLIISQKFEENRGRLPWPVDKGIITLHFGPNKIPGKTKTITVPSDGLTIETAIGAPVKAVFDGEVRSVFNVGDKQVVMIRHGKYFTVYSNLSNASVSKGQMVTAGQVIGKAGINDEGVGSIDLQIETETSTINPEPWLRK
jgi:septal ring factor EnvC (AmiA/AmiB activator)